MGEEIRSGEPVTFSVDVAGTAGIERIELHRGSETIYSCAPVPESPLDRIKILWRGARSKQRARQLVWEGGIELSEGRIRHVQSYRLDYPNEEWKRQGERQVTFRSLTSGDEDGLILEVESPKSASLQFEARMLSRNQFGSESEGRNRIQLSLPLKDLDTQDWVHPLEGLDCAVVARRVARSYPNEAHFEWTEKQTPAGTSAYWVRVLQQDGAVAWSSPIFVTR
jgi:hypothetical protein